MINVWLDLLDAFSPLFPKTQFSAMSHAAKPWPECSAAVSPIFGCWQWDKYNFASHLTVAKAGMVYCTLDTDIVYKIWHAQEDAGP